MRSSAISSALLLSLCLLPAKAQSIMEFGDLRAGAAGTGAGAGMSAGLGHKNALNKSFQKATKAMTAAQKAAFDTQTQAINQYWSSGCRYEVAKQWANAEKTFAYVLQVVTLRDGAKSSTRVPVLQKLVTATKAQKKLDQAIGYQKSIVDYHKGASRPDERAIVKMQADLSGLYLDKHDYAAAEPILKDSVALYAKYPSLPQVQRMVTLRTYSKVLRNLKKNEEADKVDLSITQNAGAGKVLPTAVEVKPPVSETVSAPPATATPEAPATAETTAKPATAETLAPPVVENVAPVVESSPAASSVTSTSADPLPPQVALPQPVEATENNPEK
ncbi:MAG: hypothetical protein K2Y22_00790 [Candidatus Obscuribacterales bacterium]|nr:hypothetical protein [Candidatus Obscuribacterales bacterium]